MPRDLQELPPQDTRDRYRCWACEAHTENFDTKATPFCDRCLNAPPANRDMRFGTAIAAARQRLDRWKKEDAASKRRTKVKPVVAPEDADF
jgi:hypothetical protein